MADADSPNDFNRIPETLPRFNGAFLGFIILASVLAIFFLLYFNRVFSWSISKGIRAWSWHKHRIHIDIQALQISLLGGRIFFTGLKYHGNNEAFHIQHGYITWRYWLRRVRDVDIKDSKRNEHQLGGESPKKGENKKELPCRITVTVAGLEWFVYNRTPVYDGILAGLTGNKTEDAATTGTSEETTANLRNRGSKLSEKLGDEIQPVPVSNHGAKNTSSTPGAPDSPEWNSPQQRSSTGRSSSSDLYTGSRTSAESQSDLPAMLQLFPIYITCQKAALVVGNENTKAIMVVKANSLTGEVNASATKGPDPYRQVFKIKFDRPVIEMKDNEDYKEDQVVRASKGKQEPQGSHHFVKAGFLMRHKRRTLGRLRNLVPYWRKSVESFFVDSGATAGATATHVPSSGQWQGLARYLDDDDRDSKTRWSNVEYAAATTLIDSPEATLTVYWDSPARITDELASRRINKGNAISNINGATSPEWGINLSLKGGTANYGPWADRRRADLQRVFLPGLSKDATPAKPLPTGAFRVSTQFKLYVELEEELTLRIPTRETSKNWRWKGKEPTTKDDRPHQTRKQRAKAKKHSKGDAAPLRPAGWLDFKIAANATISYSMDSVAGTHGYKMGLDLDLPGTELSSSVNHELLWRSGAQRVRCDLSTPLSWNALRSWHFNVSANDMELFLLRDHVFLLIDLVDDWASGPPAEYLVFTPFRYNMNIDLRNFKLYLNVNDGNIINKPTDLDDNAYLVLSTPVLASQVCIPIDKYRPSKNTIPFDIKAESFSLALHVPPWNTQASFLTSKEVGQGENLTVNGGYTYNATTSPANTDILTLNVSGQSPTATIHGFIIRYALKLKDNYFGDDVHFKTLDEYQETLQLRERDPEAEAALRPPPKKSNDLDVVLHVRVDDTRLLIPANLWSTKRNIQVETASITADLRFTNYYMDLELAVSPLNLSLGTSDSGMETPISATSSTQLFIDGLGIYGHRLFGLPPTEPTYLCNWDLSVGTVTGECTADFLAALMRGGQVFGFEFDDDENALIPYSSIVMYDVTFLRVAVQSVRVWLHVEEAAFLLSTETIDVKFNDWARTHYSKRADIRIPNLQVSCVNSEAAARQRSRLPHNLQADALLKATIHVAIVGRKFNFSEERKLQQELVRREDQRTHRTDFLLLPGLLDELVPDPIDAPATAPPVVPDPAVMEHDDEQSSSRASTIPSNNSRSLRHKSSFLSISTATSNDSNVSTDKTRLLAGYPKSNHSFRDSRAMTPSGSIGRSRRDLSASTGRQPSVYGMLGESHGRDQHSSMAFSSQFHPPHFPLEHAQPGTSGLAAPSLDLRDLDADGDATTFGLDDVDTDVLSDDNAYSSTIIELPSGITACLNPVSVRYVSGLIAALQPTDPEDILDSLQMNAVTNLVDEQKQAKVKSHIKDVLLKIPRASIRFLNAENDNPEAAQNACDQYDITFSQLALTSRSASKTAQSLDKGRSTAAQTKTSLMLRLGSAEASVAERSPGLAENQAAVMAEVDRVVLSVGSKDVTYIDGEIDAIRSSTASGKVDYLASLVHRTGLVASELGALLSETVAHHERRMKLLIHTLVTEGQTAPDPTFLVRPSAVLRSAAGHLRTADAWKLAVRLRQIYVWLPATVRDRLLYNSLSSTITVPPHAREQVISSFQRWRGWDLDNISGSQLIASVFGGAPDHGNTPQPMIPLLVAFRLREVQLILDPGPKQNRLFLSDLTARLEKKPKDTARKTTEPEDMPVLNINCNDAAINLNWELCELADVLLRLYNGSRRRDSPASQTSTEAAPDRTSDVQARPPMHVVMALSRGSVEVDTINLSAKILGNNLKASLLTHSLEDESTSLNFILSCDAVTSRLHHRSQLLGMFQLRNPSVFISHELQELDVVSCHTIKSTASSQSLTLVVRQDPIVLLEVVDVLVKDELAQLYQLKEQLPSSPPTHSDDHSIAERMSSFRVNVAMFLDEYDISVPLLQSLTYNLSGVVSRAAVAANFGKELIFDFDIKENQHDFRVNVNNQPRSISLLRIPPTNGRIKSRMGPTEHSVTVFASVELIQLDASAVYSLLGALNRPQISNTLNEAQEQIKSIQEHATDIFGREKLVKEPQVSSPPTQKQKLVYTVHATLAGLEIFGNTPLKSGEHDLAYLCFSLDRMHLEVANRHDAHRPILAQPELHVNLRSIMFDIQKGSEGAMRSCGSITFGALISASTRHTDAGEEERSFNFKSDGLDIQLSPETISTVMEILGYMGGKIKDLDTSRELEYLRKIRQPKPRIALNDEEQAEPPDLIDSFLSSLVYQFEIQDTQISWFVGDAVEMPSLDKEDLILSIKLISFGTRQANSARLTIEDFQLQMVPPGQDPRMRSRHSALLPEVVFNIAYVSTPTARRLACQAVGKSLDLRLTSGFIIPVANLKDSITLSISNVQKASEDWIMSTTHTKPDGEKRGAPRIETPTLRPAGILGKKGFESLLVDADFAGAVVHVSGKKATGGNRTSRILRQSAAGGKYGQFNPDESGSSTVLRSPGVACKIEYRDNDQEDPALYGEIKVDASSNTLYPSVVPLIMEIMSSVKEVVGDDTSPSAQTSLPQLKAEVSNEDNILTADPNAVLGRLKLNLGLRICRQEFSLSCQPIARVAATACFDDIYFTANTVRSVEQGNFFAISGAFTNLTVSVQHVYSRESTASFEVESIVLSFMNSKHVSGTSGVSAILKVSPMNMSINAKQLQDFLLFREIWYPKELRQGSAAPVAKLTTETSQGHLVQRYQQVAATAAFPWTATISITSLDVSVDLGQAIGKSAFKINNFWVSSKKTSDWEQNLCLGIDKVGIDCTGRLSGFVELQNFKLRTSIQWPEREAALNETPMIQASIGFSQFRVKAAFDYQAFLVADITSLEFLMYNVRRSLEGSGDRLVAIFDGDAVQIFGTTNSAAQGLSLYQAVQKLIQERRANFETSLKEIEKFMRRRSRGNSSTTISSPQTSAPPKLPVDDTLAKSPISLDTDVVVTLKALNLGIFPNTFSDHQVFKIEALDAHARFAASMEQRRIHSILDLTLGQLRIGLAGVRNSEAPKTLSEITVEDVVARATGSRGGTILKVPKLEAIMQTWQRPDGNRIEYTFKSAFGGKVEVGWNYSRISYIRGMWAKHAKSLEQTWGKELPLPLAAIKVTGVPEAADSEDGGQAMGGSPRSSLSAQQQQQQQKITAEVNVPQSKYDYVALEPAIIETPQLRDMGEATPPLEWIGLHRDRMPNLTHQIVIVSLLELAGEVEDAYGRIMGSS
ncbi:hypothetical protein D7B24_001929 [Verticillium nonalfalfae]|nr:uncharacterized protein D7B24_001929 [Verticillium nonalfalfae]RNJ53407.1 hypothetical protein D7B24_001929 [Verticillium nonalfalfae]